MWGIFIFIFVLGISKVSKISNLSAKGDESNLSFLVMLY